MTWEAVVELMEEDQWNEWNECSIESAELYAEQLREDEMERNAWAAYERWLDGEFDEWSNSVVERMPRP